MSGSSHCPLELRNPEKRGERRNKLNWKWIYSKKAATDTAIRLLVAFIAGLTFIAVIALFAVWRSVCTIEAAVGRKSRSLKESYHWFVVPEVQRSKDAIDGQMWRASQVGFADVT